MRDAIIIAPSGIDLEGIAASILEAQSISGGGEETRLRLGNAEMRQDQSLAQHYEDEDGEKISSVGENPQFFLINFKDIADLKKIILSISMSNLLIDNDFGLIEPVSSFASRWQQNPEWDWVK